MKIENYNDLIITGVTFLRKVDGEEMNHYFGYDEDGETVPNVLFESVEEDAAELREKLLNMTLGQVKKYVEKANILNTSEISTLSVILEKRNDLIHQYFKRMDFEEHADNWGFLEHQRNYLKKLKNKTQHLNDRLCQLIDKKQKEYDLIEDV